MKNRLLITIIISTKEQSGQNKEEKKLEREPIGCWRVFVVKEMDTLCLR